MLIKHLLCCKYSKNFTQYYHFTIFLSEKYIFKKELIQEQRFFHQNCTQISLHWDLVRFLAPRPLLHQQQKKSHSEEQLFLWCHQESNRGHKDFQSFALPTELWHHFCKSATVAFKQWCHQESNRGHKDFQSFALPTELWHLADLRVQK